MAAPWLVSGSTMANHVSESETDCAHQYESTEEEQHGSGAERKFGIATGIMLLIVFVVKSSAHLPTSG